MDEEKLCSTKVSQNIDNSRYSHYSTTKLNPIYIRLGKEDIKDKK